MTDRSAPSEVWTSVLRRLLPAEDREYVVTELAELYRIRVSVWGKARADRWYRSEVLQYAAVLRPTGLGGWWRRAHRFVYEGVMGDFWNDLRRAGRSLTRNPGFTVVAVATLTLGIGANTVIFSVVDHVALRSLPYPQSDELVAVWPNRSMLRGDLDIMRRESGSFTSLGAYLLADGFNLQTPDGSRRIRGHHASAALLATVGVQPMLGRGFLPEDETGGEVVLLGYGLWRNEFGADSGVVGRGVVLDGRTRTVVGVLPPDLAFPAPDQDVLVPLAVDPANPGVYWGSGGVMAVGRLRPGVTPEMAEAEIGALTEQMRQANTLWTPIPTFYQGGQIVPLRDAVVGEVEATLLILLGAVGLLLLVACANVSNLLLARGLSRGRDVALRAALGAGRWRLIREHLTESLLLALAGSAIALVTAQWALAGIVSLLPADIPRANEIVLDARIVMAGIGFAVLAGVVAGVVPAFRGSRTDPATALREGGRGSAGGGGRAHRRITAAMVVAQVAAAVVLVVSAGLLVRSLDRLARIEPGFRTDDILTARLTVAGGGFDDGAARYAYYSDVAARIAALPGVESASLGRRVPFGPGASSIATGIDGVTDDPNSLPVFNRYQVMPGYLETMGIPLLAGRGFTPADRADAPLVVLVDQTAAERFWPGESPIGRRIRYPWQGAPWMEVVGVVGNVADGDLAAAPRSSYYQPLSQVVSEDAMLVARVEGDPARMAPEVVAAIGNLDDRVPVSAVGPLSGLVSRSLARARWTAVLLAVFAGTTLLLGAVGVYGVVAYSVRARTQEIGVRMALGADRRRIRGAILRDGLRLTGPGAALGLLLAIPAGRLLEGLLYGVSTLDPVTFAVVPVVLVAVGALAVLIPARRAMTVDPVEALRAE